MVLILLAASIGPASAESNTTTASFTTNVSSGYVPLTVQFTDTSTNATAWEWNFGDGTNSTEQNPEHTYSTAGNYTVVLLVHDSYENVLKGVSMSMVSTLENSETTPQWNYAENLGDDHGITFGAVGFCTGTYDGNILIHYYTTLNPNNNLAKYIPVLDAIDAENDILPGEYNDNVSGLENFISDVQSCDDPLFKQAQLYEIDELYWNPAVEKFGAIGASRNLTQAYIYECSINHGLNGAQTIIDGATTNCSGTPGSGVDESTYLASMIDVRNATYGTTTRNIGWSNLVIDGNLDIVPNFTFYAWGDEFTITGDIGVDLNGSDVGSNYIVVSDTPASIVVDTTDVSTDSSAISLVEGGQSGLYDLYSGVTSIVSNGYALATLSIITLAAAAILRLLGYI